MKKPTVYDLKGHKICPRCNTGKPKSEYYFVGHARDHLSYFCKSCRESVGSFQSYPRILTLTQNSDRAASGC